MTTTSPQRLCRRVLERAGYRVLAALDGVEAVKVALRERPSLVLMDFALPGIDGLEAMRRIKIEFPSIPVVIASASAMSSEQTRYLAAGADAVLTKPFRLADLVATVNKFARPE